MDYHKELKKKLSASYERQVKQWMASDPAQLIAAAEDIAASASSMKTWLIRLVMKTLPSF